MHLPRWVYQHKYHAAAAAADNCCRDAATFGRISVHASLGCGKRTLQCDVAYHYANLIPSNSSEFNFDLTKAQFAQGNCKEEVIICVTHICLILHHPQTEKRHLNFLSHSVRIHEGTHTGLLLKGTYQLLVPISSDGEAG